MTPAVALAAPAAIPTLRADRRDHINSLPTWCLKRTLRTTRQELAAVRNRPCRDLLGEDRAPVLVARLSLDIARLRGALLARGEVAGLGIKWSAAQ